MDNNESLELLLDLHKDLSITREHLAEIKTDLKEHMKRTAILETELKFIHKQIWLAHGAIGLLSVLATIAALFKFFA